MPSPTPYFSIIIPTLNEEHFLPILLNNLSHQTFKDFQVLHIDGNSEDKTVKRAHSFQKKIPIVSHVVSDRNVSLQRNVGISQATGKWILCLDADNQLEPEFLSKLKDQLDAYQPDLFATTFSTPSPSFREKLIIWSTNVGLLLTYALKIPTAYGASMGFNPQTCTLRFDIHTRVMEDTLFVRQAVNAGHSFKLFRAPNVIMSLRRYQNEGTINMVITTLKLILVQTPLKKYLPTPQYTMLGGTNHTPPKPNQELKK